MSAAEDVMIPMTVVTNSKKTRVFFAEVDSDFTDIVLSFLTLPMGKILGLFKKHYGEEAPIIGSLNNLSNSLANIDDVHFWTSEGKQMLLDPRSTFSDDCRKLKYNLDDSPPTKYFVCNTLDCGGTKYADYDGSTFSNRTISINDSTVKCYTCNEQMSNEMDFLENILNNIYECPKPPPDASRNEGVLTVKTAYNFTISDDMQIGANNSGFVVQNLRNFGIVDASKAWQMSFSMGCNEIMGLLKGILFSRTPLTDLVIRHKTPTNEKAAPQKLNTTPNIEHKQGKNSKKMVVKAALQRSTNNFLFAQAEENFVDFLFSLLTIPLGGVAHLLGGNTCMGSVDNLYKSVASLESRDFKKIDTKLRLLEPKLPFNYLSKCQILPISEQQINLYCHSNKCTKEDYVSLSGPIANPATIIDPKGKGSYLKRGVFMVTNDLSVTPLSTISILSHFKELKIPLSDVEEVEMEIGENEALRILKESLTSTAVLTNALNPVIKSKQPKVEHKKHGSEDHHPKPKA